MGIWTPVVRVTGGNTMRCTTEDVIYFFVVLELISVLLRCLRLYFLYSTCVLRGVLRCILRCIIRCILRCIIRCTNVCTKLYSAATATEVGRCCWCSIPCCRRHCCRRVGTLPKIKKCGIFWKILQVRGSRLEELGLCRNFEKILKIFPSPIAQA